LEQPLKKKRKTYDPNKCKFQETWVAKPSWAKGAKVGVKMHLVKCNICSTIEGKPKYYVTKWDITSRR
jgi:hypothetical protein